MNTVVAAILMAATGLWTGIATAESQGKVAKPAAPALQTVASRSADRVVAPDKLRRQLFLRSSSAVVLDQITGAVIYDKNADETVPIASLTKLMTAMVVLDAQLPLTESIAISKEDVDRKRGSKSRLTVGSKLSREKLLHLALMASENRAAAALGRAYPGGKVAFVAAMNKKARELGLRRTVFRDSTGLDSGNMSTAKEMAIIVNAAHRYQHIRRYSTAFSSAVQLPRYRDPLQYHNTNALVKSAQWDIGLSKTGYTSDAGNCLALQAQIAGRPVIIVLLDSWGKNSRIGDANRIRKWLEKHPQLVQVAG